MADHAAKTGLSFGNGFYDGLRRTVEFVFPGVGALYFALAELWGLPYANEIVGTLAALAVFGGVLLAMSRKTYNKTGQYDGEIVPDANEAGELTYRFQLNTDDGAGLLNKDKIVFKGIDQTQL